MMKKFYVIGNRPTVPGIICNAPRPIMGHHTWQGDFIHGIFYAAIDPCMGRAEIMIEENRKLDAWELIFEDIETAKEVLRQKYPKYAKYVDIASDEKIIQTYHVIKNERD